MEENLHKDNLESFFKKEFDNLPDTPAEDGWDLPSEDNWHGIAAGMTDSPKGISGWWIKIFTGIIFIGLLGTMAFLIYKNNKNADAIRLQAHQIEMLEKELKAEKNKRTDTTTQSNAQRTDTPEHLNNTNKTTDKPSEPSISLSGKNNSNFKISKTTTTDLNKQSNTHTNDPPSTIETTEPASSTSSFEIVKTDQLADAASEQISATAGITPPVHVPINFLETPDPGIPYAMIMSSGVIKPVSKVSFYAGAYIAPSFTRNTIKSSGAPLLFKSSEQEIVSHETGVKSGIKIGDHFTLSTGIGQSNASLRTRQTFRVDYNANSETQIGNEYESTYMLSVASSNGTSEVEVDLRRSSTDIIPNGQKVLLDVRSRQKLQYIYIPILAGYEWQRKRMVFGIQSGFSINLLRSTTFEAQVTSKHMRLQRHNPPRVTRQLTETQRAGFDYVIGAKAGLNLTPSIQLALEPVFRTSLTPVVSNEDFTSKPNSFGLQAGLYYRF